MVLLIQYKLLIRDVYNIDEENKSKYKLVQLVVPTESSRPSLLLACEDSVRTTKMAWTISLSTRLNLEFSYLSPHNFVLLYFELEAYLARF